MTEAKVNFNFEEVLVDSNQVLVQNTEGRTVEHLELVLCEKYFGEVCEFDGIADDAYGMININHNRLIETTQIAVGDTFVLGEPVYFDPGGAGAAGELEATGGSGNVAVGICTRVNNGVSVQFRPFVQRLNATGLVVT